MFLDGDEAAEMRAFLDSEIPRATWDELGAVTTDEGAVERHLQRIFAIPFIDLERDPRAQRSTWRWTACAARAAPSFTRLLDELGCRWTPSTWRWTAAFPASRSRWRRT